MITRSVTNPEGLKRLLVLFAFAAAVWVGHPALALFVGALVSVAVAPDLPRSWSVPASCV